MTMRSDSRLRRQFMIIAAAMITLLVAAAVAVIDIGERAQMERQLRQLSVNEMTSLHALILNVMAKRPEDPDNIGVTVFNKWFDSRNKQYPGAVWSVWGPKVAAYMHDSDPARSPKVARDDVDREALDTRVPIGRFVDGAYRYALPIVLGVTEGAQGEVCHTCHGGMGMQDGEVIAVLSSSLSTADMEAQLRRTLLWLVGGGIAAAAVAVVGVYFAFGRLVGAPLASLSATMQYIEESGDLGAEVAVRSPNEIGAIAEHLRSLLARLKTVFAAIDTVMGQVSRGDMTRRIEVDAKGSLLSLKSNVNLSLDSLSRVLGDIAGNMARVADGSAQANHTVATISEGARDQLRALRLVTAEIQNTADAIDAVSGNATASSARAREALKLVETGSVRVGEMLTAVNAIAVSSQSIGQATTAIAQITGQTKMLSLNAAIEAARAGEQGKGFAVVAHEVGRLAESSATAATAIADLIASAGERSGEGVTLSRAVKDSFDRLSRSVADADRMADAIATAMAEEKGAVARVSANVRALADIAEATAASAEEIAANVAALADIAAATRSAVDTFRY